MQSQKERRPKMVENNKVRALEKHGRQLDERI
jgi:hypothetical protein